jgi:hypothetical protein
VTAPAPSAALSSAAALPDIEQPACFYLGREFDLEAKKVKPDPIMYDARDLTTHGVIVGMTGSGKTGLGISLLEEAAIDGIPCIIVDPKGDLTNLLLQFPDLRPEDFKPWLDADEARTKKMSLDDYARQTAERWRKGLEETYQQPQRIGLLKESADRRVYTPGSEAGLSLSVLKSFAPPAPNTPREDLHQKIDATVSALLALAGITADPVQSREHIFLAQILLHSWSSSKSIDLAGMIAQIQTPPAALEKVGAFDVETFYPEKERLKLALALNNILAAPSFSTWTVGEPLDLSRMLYDQNNKPRQLIFSIAHLEDAQRMFFLTLLFEEVLSWTRKQPGTSSLRAIVYFDEVFGYLPPHPANPPTKLPLMTLLKQARAFGVGMLLATQNPVDLDYKALSNAGTWFVGKLQTERDKARLVEGLEGVAAEQGTLSNRGYLETVISALNNRVFLLHDVHKGKPVLFQSRQALSFLRGPMTREQIAQLMAPIKAREAAPAAVKSPNVPIVPTAIPLCKECKGELLPGAPVCPRCGATVATPRVQDQNFKQALQRSAAAVPSGSATPPLADDVPQFYLPLLQPGPASYKAVVLYQPRLVGVAEVQFLDKRRKLSHRQSHKLLAEPPAHGQPNWQIAERLQVEFTAVRAGARWGTIPDSINSARKLKALEKTFSQFLYDVARLTLFENRDLSLIGPPGEDLLTFRDRCRAAACQLADKAIANERLKFQPKFEAEGGKMPQAPAEKSGSMLDAINPFRWLGLGGQSTPPPASNKLQRLQAEWEAKQAAILEKWTKIGEEYSEISLTPRREDVKVIHFGIAWLPAWAL